MKILIVHLALFVSNVILEPATFQDVLEMPTKLVMALTISVSSLRQMIPWSLLEMKVFQRLHSHWRVARAIVTQMQIGTCTVLLSLITAD